MKKSGYEARSSDGTIVRVTGGGTKDEVHTGSVTGSVNVSRIWRDIEAATRGEQPWRVEFLRSPINDNTLSMLTNQDVDEAAVARIDAARSDVPLLIVPTDDGTYALIDGVHRLYWRWKNRCEFFTAYALTPHALIYYRVRYRLKPRGSSVWRDISPEEILRRTKGVYPVLDENKKVIGRRVDPAVRARAMEKDVS